MYGYASKKYVLKVGVGMENNIPETIVYSVHVANVGWQGEKNNGNIAGTTGQNKQMEAIKIHLKDIEYNGSVEYSAHVSDIGWQNFVKDDNMAGTTGRNKAMEAIKIRLTGEVSKYYNI